MKFPLSWLQDYVTIDEAPLQIAKKLTQLGIEVDSVEPSALSFQRVVVGKVNAVAKHPSADKLQIATVFDGSQELQVVCGAPNCRPGLKTALAVVGATLKDEAGKVFTIKKSKVRDVESFGMLCSAKELQLGECDEGIIEFPDELVEGTDLGILYGDTIFEVSLTPNLGHCMSLTGVARELAAANSVSLRQPIVSLQEGTDRVEENIRVIIEDKEGCPRYACRVVKNVKVAPSPEWLQKRLIASGVRPINNVVDATNYVLLELGHPLHAFDMDKLQGPEIIVRRAIEGERFITLDGKERVLAASDLLICDQQRPVALAGVMGGQNSEVHDQTVNILIESAYFTPSVIRKTSKTLGLQTDASRRFERFADPNQVIKALDRAAMIIQEIAGGDICQGVMDIKTKDFPNLSLHCRLSRINQLLGTHLGVSEVESVFHRLGFHFHWDGQNTFTVSVPTYRGDIGLEVDLIEEVARVYGYDNIPLQQPRYHASTLPCTPLFVFEGRVRTHMLAEGLQEFLTCDLIGPALMDIVKDNSMPPEAIIKVLNPTSIEQSVLRTSLLPGLLQVVKHNADHQIPDVHGFEVGRVHFKQGEQFIEQSVLGIVLSGNAFPVHWDQPAREMDFYDLKGMIENLFAGLRIKGVEFKQNNLDTFHSGRQASIFVGSLEVGSMGEVHPAIQRRLDVPRRILFAELNLPDLYRLCPAENKMEALPLYPASERDWTITVKEEVPVEQVLNVLLQTPSRLLESTHLVTVYRSEKLGTGLKNVTFHFVYRDRKKTIAQETVDAEHARIIEQAQKKLSEG
jgi:phenylalanyl-tRNA synthetase beta chain